HPRIAPPSEMLPNIRVGREVMGQVAPLAAGACLVEDRVPDLAQRIGPRPTRLARLRLGKDPLEHFPLRVRQITRVGWSFHTLVLPRSPYFLYTLSGFGRTPRHRRGASSRPG